MLEIGVRPRRRLGGAVDVLTVVVFLRSSGFQHLFRGGWGASEGDLERPSCYFIAS